MKALIELVAILIIAGLTYLGVQVMQANAPSPPKKVVKEHIAYVEVTPAHAAEHTLVVNAEGQIVAPDRLTLSPEISGRLVEVSPQLQAGASIPAGTLIARIDDADAQVALTSARANVAAAEASVALEQTRAEVALADWRELNTGTPPAVVARTSELALARAQVAVARAAVAQAELQLARTRITLPFEARVVSESAALGQRVDPMTVLATFERSDNIEAHLTLELGELGLLGLDPRGAGADNLAIELSARVGGERLTWSARGVRTLTSLSPTNPVVTLVANVAVPPTAVPPPAGLFVQARIAGRKVQAFALPTAAVELDGRALVMDTDPETGARTVHWIETHPLHSTPTQTFVPTGGALADGDQVVTTPPPVVVEGMPVRLVEEAE